jgi:hypothetical protein
MAQAVIDTFQNGFFSVAVGGEAWESSSSKLFRAPPSARSFRSCGCTIRKTIHKLLVAVDGKKAWSAKLRLRLAALLSIPQPMRSWAPVLL